MKQNFVVTGLTLLYPLEKSSNWIFNKTSPFSLPDKKGFFGVVNYLGKASFFTMKGTK